MSLLLHNKGSNIKLPQLAYKEGRKKEEQKSQYSRLTSEEERLKYLGFRDDLMCREIVIKRNKV